MGEEMVLMGEVFAVVGALVEEVTEIVESGGLVRSEGAKEFEALLGLSKGEANVAIIVNVDEEVGS